MSFNENVTLDTSQVRSGGRGGGPGGMVVGGGIGGIVLVILAMIFGIDPSQLPTGGGQLDPGQVQAGGQQDGDAFSRCQTGADANADVECRVIGTVNSVQAFWEGELVRFKREWQPTQTVLYSGTTQSGCGTASNQVGPFYCPLDKSVYIDASFFEVLTQRFGADDGALAQEYVVAHEYGHALQDQLGLLGRAQQDPQGAESGAVRVELMADCLAGVWAQHASAVADEDTGTPFLKQLTQSDIDSALSAAAAVGDDRIQEKTSGRVTPESWTHGSAEARQQWFMTGFRTGDLNRCDTFAVQSVYER
ncbi:neutral zinc metallopeptidase [Phycicoccus sp. CSK15P-2]|uniref:KPN_02809 family neutral zinc metallopeptidase n=1 Tax=Phycicoccus sp. CSK15P-2 TaxID=2807627 RepID=UPI00194FEB06|nr:neutral zinc metallopeptidase [Phycicoccus sp. CSK15P-2]MBM6403861.1 neutral zinc metallopeptidase [Phycicoccus sp. CSK15P-2]